ncbi:hypothetical protein NKCBBBOE_03927 [Pseudarthrobacter sp. MM222]|nr:hypothetical protein NKCBBBOE_03927 [Pseudarthrobacter sp. MM222]
MRCRSAAPRPRVRSFSRHRRNVGGTRRCATRVVSLKGRAAYRECGRSAGGRPVRRYIRAGDRRGASSLALAARSAGCPAAPLPCWLTDDLRTVLLLVRPSVVLGGDCLCSPACRSAACPPSRPRGVRDTLDLSPGAASCSLEIRRQRLWLSSLALPPAAWRISGRMRRRCVASKLEPYGARWKLRDRSGHTFEPPIPLKGDEMFGTEEFTCRSRGGAAGAERSPR